MTKNTASHHEVLDNVLTTIEASRKNFVQARSRSPVPLYWQVGKCIRATVRGDPTTEKAKKLIDSLARKLSPTYGKEFTSDNLTKMVEFTAQFTDYDMVSTLSKQLTWEHFQTLITIDDDIKRDFYAWMSLAKGWNPKALRSRIKTEFYEKTPVTETASHKDKGDFTKNLTSRVQDLRSLLGLDQPK